MWSHVQCVHPSLEIPVETLESIFKPLWGAVGTEAMRVKTLGLLGPMLKVKHIKKKSLP